MESVAEGKMAMPTLKRFHYRLKPLQTDYRKTSSSFILNKRKFQVDHDQMSKPFKRSCADQPSQDDLDLLRHQLDTIDQSNSDLESSPVPSIEFEEGQHDQTALEANQMDTKPQSQVVLEDVKVIFDQALPNADADQKIMDANADYSDHSDAQVDQKTMEELEKLKEEIEARNILDAYQIEQDQAKREAYQKKVQHHRDIIFKSPRLLLTESIIPNSPIDLMIRSHLQTSQTRSCANYIENMPSLTFLLQNDAKQIDKLSHKLEALRLKSHLVRPDADNMELYYMHIKELTLPQWLYMMEHSPVWFPEPLRPELMMPLMVQEAEFDFNLEEIWLRWLVHVNHTLSWSFQQIMDLLHILLMGRPSWTASNKLTHRTLHGFHHLEPSSPMSSDTMIDLAKHLAQVDPFLQVYLNCQQLHTLFLKHKSLQSEYKIISTKNSFGQFEFWSQCLFNTPICIKGCSSDPTQEGVKFTWHPSTEHPDIKITQDQLHDAFQKVHHHDHHQPSKAYWIRINSISHCASRDDPISLSGILMASHDSLDTLFSLVNNWKRPVAKSYRTSSVHVTIPQIEYNIVPKLLWWASINKLLEGRLSTD